MKDEESFEAKACNWESLPRYLKGDFVKRVARLQRGPLEKLAWTAMNSIEALHGSGCRLWLVRMIGPKLTTLASSALFLPFLAYLLRLTAQVVQSEEVHRHVCAQHASTHDQTTARLLSFTRYFKRDIVTQRLMFINFLLKKLCF